MLELSCMLIKTVIRGNFHKIKEEVNGFYTGNKKTSCYSVGIKVTLAT